MLCKLSIMVRALQLLVINQEQGINHASFLCKSPQFQLPCIFIKNHALWRSPCEHRGAPGKRPSFTFLSNVDKIVELLLGLWSESRNQVSGKAFFWGGGLRFVVATISWSCSTKVDIKPVFRAAFVALVHSQLSWWHLFGTSFGK